MALPKNSLINLIPDFLDWIEYNENAIELSAKLHDLYKDQISKHIIEKIRSDVSRISAQNVMIERMVPVNIVPNYINKISNLYEKEPIRVCEIESDTQIVNELIDYMDFDVVLQQAVETTNLHKRCLIEPYLHDNKPRLRAIPAHKFLPWTDDKIDPSKPTVIIKFMGETKDYTDSTNTKGIKLESNDRLIERVKLFHAWSENEFIIFDSNGALRDDIMREQGLESTENPLKKMPFIYINTDKTELIPDPDESLFRMATTLPLLLSDLNFALKYLSHSILYAVNADPSSFVETGADSILFLLSHEDNLQATPELHALTPSVDSDKALNLIREQFKMWLDSRGLKTTNNGSVDTENISGIAKMIDNVDVTKTVDKLKSLFKNVEYNLWDLIKDFYNEIWIGEIDSNLNTLFTNKFNLSIEYQDSKPYVDSMQEINKQESLLNLRLVTKKFALQRIYPNMEQKEIEDLIAEAEKLNPYVENFLNTPGFQFSNQNLNKGVNNGNSNPISQ